MDSRIDPEWYKKIWTWDIQNLPLAEQTAREVNFLVGALGLRGRERILDLACGFGRHALELARRGFSVVGVDVSSAYVDEARKRAAETSLKVEFVCADARDVSYSAEFDVVLNLSDGAIGFLENDNENLKVFDRIALALRPGGKHLMRVCNAAYARKHFPRRHWDMGSDALSLADFAWDAEASRMSYAAFSFKYGDALTKPEAPPSPVSVRLYTIDELRDILKARGMTIERTYGAYSASVPSSDDTFPLLVVSRMQSF
jgi:SAM-dependent methyltransferase